MCRNNFVKIINFYVKVEFRCHKCIKRSLIDVKMFYLYPNWLLLSTLPTVNVLEKSNMFNTFVDIFISRM